MLNLITVRRSNGDRVVTQVVIVGNQARAFVAPDTDLPIEKNGTPMTKKAHRHQFRQPLELQPTRCYASSVCRGYCHSKKK